MIITKDWITQFRDADESGRIGLKGYMNYFQDIASYYWFEMEKGNDVIPEKYGISWVYTKYKVHICDEADFSGKLHLESWVDQIKNHFLVTQGMRISMHGKIMAEGKLESCLMDLSKNKLTRTTAAEIPEDTEEGQSLQVEDFLKFPKSVDGMQSVYTHTVRYTDLDKSHHMTNLRYVDVILNVFDGDFYRRNQITDFEIHFVQQCFEGDSIEMFVQNTESGYFIFGRKQDGTMAVFSQMKTKERE